MSNRLRMDASLDPGNPLIFGSGESMPMRQLPIVDRLKAVRPGRALRYMATCGHKAYYGIACLLPTRLGLHDQPRLSR